MCSSQVSAGDHKYHGFNVNRSSPLLGVLLHQPPSLHPATNSPLIIYDQGRWPIPKKKNRNTHPLPPEHPRNWNKNKLNSKYVEKNKIEQRENILE